MRPPVHAEAPDRRFHRAAARPARRSVEGCAGRALFQPVRLRRSEPRDFDRPEQSEPLRDRRAEPDPRPALSTGQRLADLTNWRWCEDRRLRSDLAGFENNYETFAYQIEPAALLRVIAVFCAAGHLRSGADGATLAAIGARLER